MRWYLRLNDDDALYKQNEELFQIILVNIIQLHSLQSGTSNKFILFRFVKELYLRYNLVYYCFLVSYTTRYYNVFNLFAYVELVNLQNV